MVAPVLQDQHPLALAHPALYLIFQRQCDHAPHRARKIRSHVFQGRSAAQELVPLRPAHPVIHRAARRSRHAPVVIRHRDQHRVVKHAPQLLIKVERIFHAVVDVKHHRVVGAPALGNQRFQQGHRRPVHSVFPLCSTFCPGRAAGHRAKNGRWLFWVTRWSKYP